MPAWLIPALKAALPHVASIVAAASPAFTRKNTADQNVLQQQITELQSAATTNDAKAPDREQIEFSRTLGELTFGRA